MAESADELVLPLANALQRAMARAIMVVADERAHHFLCIRSIFMASNLKGLFQLAWAGPWKSLDADTKDVVRKWYADIDAMEGVAVRERESEFEAVKRRTIVFLADLAENYIESIPAIYKRYLDETGEVTRILSGRKPKDIKDPRDVRKSVRAWERSIPHKERTKRIEEMLQFYMPRFVMPPESLGALDELFEKRNALTHELVLIGDLHDEARRSATAQDVSLERVDHYFQAVEELILASMRALTTDTATPDAPSLGES